MRCREIHKEAGKRSGIVYYIVFSIHRDDDGNRNTHHLLIKYQLSLSLSEGRTACATHDVPSTSPLHSSKSLHDYSSALAFLITTLSSVEDMLVKVS